MSIAVYELKSPLSQVSAEQANAFLESVSAFTEAPLRARPLDAYLQADFGLLFIASGGSEGLFKAAFSELSGKPFYLLSSPDSNSLAASMEILAYLKQRGCPGEILHGDPAAIGARIGLLSKVARAKAALANLRIGVVGAPSDWLIASGYSAPAYRERLGAEVVEIPMWELLDAYAKKPALQNEWTQRLRAMDYDPAELERALTLYAALRQIVEKYRLGAVTVRCFDLLDSIHTTGCLALSILNAEGVYAGCEGDVPAAMSMAILGAVSGEPVFMCNPSRIMPNEQAMVLAHCTLPINMPDRMRLTTHYESGIGVAIAGHIPEGCCTIMKAAGDLSRFYCKAGIIEKNLSEPTLCRSQIQVRLDDFSYFFENPIQNHHLICKGDHVAALEELFCSIGCAPESGVKPSAK